MSSRLRRLLTAAVAAGSIVSLCAGSAEAQAPTQGGPLRWAKAAPFPEPEEELYGTVVNNKLYVIGGFGIGGNAPGLVYEYDAAADRWTKKKNMPLHVHHQAQTAYNGKIILPSIPGALHGNAAAFIGNRFHTVSGKPEGGGLPDLAGKATASHDVLEIPAAFGTQ